MPWIWSNLCMNPNVTLKDVLEYQNKTWSWYWLSQNMSVTLEDVLEHPDLPWSWTGLSANPNITFKNVLEHPDKPWNWSILSSNTFGYKKTKKMDKSLQNAIKMVYIERECRPGGVIYQDAKNSFNGHVSSSNEGV